MAASEEKSEELNTITIADFDEHLAKLITDELMAKGFIKKGKDSAVTTAINDLKIANPDKPNKTSNFNGKKPDRDANLIKKLIPFAGECIDGRCQALNNNHGLFNQCDKKPVGKSLYCKGCASPNATSGLTKVESCGKVQDRIDQYDEHGDLNKYKTPSNEVTNKAGDIVIKNGVCAKSLGKVLETINNKRGNDGKELITVEQVQEEASKVNIQIPEECLEVPLSKRGRKAGSKNSTPTSSDGEAPKKKQRGRPKKNATKNVEQVAEQSAEQSVEQPAEQDVEQVIEQSAEQLANLNINRSSDDDDDDDDDDELSDEE